MSEDHQADIDAIVETCRPVLAGHPPQIQGAALAILLATFVAGHHPELRRTIFDLQISATWKLVPVMEKEIEQLRKAWTS